MPSGAISRSRAARAILIAISPRFAMRSRRIMGEDVRRLTARVPGPWWNGGEMEHIDLEGKVVYRHSVVARLSHWLWALALLVLVMSGLQIFNAAPYLDASDKSNPNKRV